MAMMERTNVYDRENIKRGMKNFVNNIKGVAVSRTLDF